MQVTQIPGVQNHVYDTTINERLKKCQLNALGKTMKVGIRNDEGYIYKEITTQSELEFITVVSTLEQLDFCDELAEDQSCLDGYDAILALKSH